MDVEDLAFAGVARQAELIRAGEVSSRELVELYLDRIERLDPQLNAFTEVRGERALAEAESADASRGERPGAPLLGVPLAIKDVSDVEGSPTWFGTKAFSGRPAGGGLRERAPPARRRRCDHREDDAARARDLRLHRVGGLGQDPQPLGHRAARPAARAAAARRRSPRAWSARRRRPTAAARSASRLRSAACSASSPSAAGCRWIRTTTGTACPSAGCVTRTVADTALYLDAVTAGGGDPGGPEQPKRPFAEAASGAPGRLRIAISERPARAILPPIVTDDVKQGLAETEEVLRSLGHDVRRHEPDFGLTGQNFVPRYLAGIRDDVDAVPHPERLEARTRGFRRLGRGYPAAIVRRATRLAAADAERINGSWSDFDVLVTPSVGETAIEVGRWQGRGALRTLLGMSRTYCFTPIWNHTGQPAAAIPAGFTARGCPARSRWSAGPATSRRCCRSRARSRRSAPGPIAGRSFPRSRRTRAARRATGRRCP